MRGQGPLDDNTAPECNKLRGSALNPAMLCVCITVVIVNLLNAGQTEKPEQTPEDGIMNRCMVDHILGGPQDGFANRVII